MEPPAGEQQLCVLLLRAEEEEKKDVGCQWEPQEETCKEVACQTAVTEKRDFSIQVDLLTQQISWRRSGSSQVLLQSFTVRPDGPDGGPLLEHCTRTRTRTIRPAPKLSPEPPQTRSRTRRGQPRTPSSEQKVEPRRRSRKSPDTGPQEEVMEEEAESQLDGRKSSDKEPEEEVKVEEEVESQHCTRKSPDLGAELEVMEEEELADPTWTPDEGEPCPSSPAAIPQEDSRRASVHGERAEPIICDVCGKVMKNKSSLARHSFIHTGQKPFSCHLCELRFNRRDNLQHHLTHLHPDGASRREKQRPAATWLCAVCGKTFSCRSRLKTHEVIHSGVKPHRCDLCPKAYMRTNDLEHHRKVVHANGVAEPPRPSSLLCDLCGKEFKCQSQLAIHFQTHTGDRPHLCDICGRKFARQYQLKRHKILVHANQTNGEAEATPNCLFSCDVCGKQLKSESLLAAHTRIHTADKPYRCGVCQRGFQSSTSLRQHHIRQHLRVREAPRFITHRKTTTTSVKVATERTEKSFPCSVCSKAFKFRSLLANHELIHSDVRPFSCDFCSRSFRRHTHLKRHREVVHANGARQPQSFVCHICGKDKKCRSQLARHVIIHTGERPFACDLCPARFNRSGNLQQHRKRMHGIGKEPDEEAAPILFDDDDVLTDKQEVTVASVDNDGGEPLDAT
ncbi:zinc finger Y-chromosomal protein-like [Pholidichthys leucotaenia]